MTRPSDYTEQFRQHMTDDLVELRTLLKGIEGEAIDRARSVVYRMQDRVLAFDLSFGRDAERDGDG